MMTNKKSKTPKPDSNGVYRLEYVPEIKKSTIDGLLIRSAEHQLEAARHAIGEFKNVMSELSNPKLKKAAQPMLQMSVRMIGCLDTAKRDLTKLSK